MVPWRATEDGFVTDDVIAWYARFAKGRPGVIVVEATGVRDIPSGPLLRIGHDRYIEGLARVADAVHRASAGHTRVFIQLIDFLAIKRRVAREKYFERFANVDDEVRARLAEVLGDERISTIPEADVRSQLSQLPEEHLSAVLPERELETVQRGYRERVTDVHLGHVEALPRVLPELFAAAASRAKSAGFDGVELHYAHAYTMASFLSALNTRTDGYGTTLEGRLRLPLEVFRAVRAEVGRTFTVGARFLGDEVIEGGTGLDEATLFGVAFGAEGFDFLSVSKGGKFEDAKQPKVGEAAYPYTGASGHECIPHIKIEGGPFGRNLSLAATIRASLREAGHATPVITSGGIVSPWQAEEILQSGEADIVASARQTLADPDWFRKVRLGRGEETRRCFFSNYCEALDQAHREVTCQRWDRDFTVDEPTTRSADGKRRLVAPDWKSSD